MPDENEMESLSVGDPGWVKMETILEGLKLMVGSAQPPVKRAGIQLMQKT